MVVPTSSNTNAGGKDEDSLPNVSPKAKSPSVPFSFSSSSPFMGPPSPLIEAGGLKGTTDISADLGIFAAGNQQGFVKIGQTGLHNPGGRSSWIGL